MHRKRPADFQRKMVFTLALGTTLTSFASAAVAQGLPEFQKGRWEFTRSIDNGAERQSLVTTRCTNPSEDMRMQRDKGAKAGCQSSPVAKSGSTYTHTVTCEFQGVPVESTSVMSVDGPGAYKIDIQSKGSGKTTNEVLVARRIGDC